MDTLVIETKTQIHKTISKKAACACPHCSNELYVSVFQPKSDYTSIFCVVCDFIGDIDNKTYNVLSINHEIQY